MLKIALFVLGLLCSHTLSSVISFGDENDYQIEMESLGTTKKQIRSTTATPKYLSTRGKPLTPTTTTPKKTTAKTTLIPASSSSTTETTTTDHPSISSQCPKSKVYFEGTNSCVGILLRGPCQKGEWIVVNEKTETGECKAHPEVCEDDVEEKQENCLKAIFEQNSSLDDSLLRDCNNTGMMLRLTRYGTVTCFCKPGLVFWKMGHACHEPFKQGPCEDGQYLNIVLKKIERHPTTEMHSTTVTSRIESTTTTQKIPTRMETNRGNNKIPELATKKRKDGDRMDIVFPVVQIPSTEKSTTLLVPRRKPRSPEIMFDDEDATRTTRVYRRFLAVNPTSPPSQRCGTKKNKDHHNVLFSNTASQRSIQSVAESQRYTHETDKLSSNVTGSPRAKDNSGPSSEKPTTSTPLTTTKTTIKPNLRYIDEMDNTGFSFIGSRRLINAGQLAGNTTDQVINENVNNLNNDTEYEPDLVCTPNPCLNGSFPIDMRILEKSPNANTSSSYAEPAVIFEEVDTQKNEEAVVCDYIGSEENCKTGFVLGVNVETFQIDCIENLDEDILTRQIMSEVPSASCGSGQRLDASGKCVNVRRFLG